MASLVGVAVDVGGEVPVERPAGARGGVGRQRLAPLGLRQVPPGDLALAGLAVDQLHDTRTAFVNEEYIGPSDRFEVFLKFGMWMEAAKAAFDTKDLDGLNHLERVCRQQDVLQAVGAFKARLKGR